MHLISSLIWIFISWKWGDKKNIGSYLATMWYVGSMNLLYHLITDEYWVWKYHSSMLSTKEIAIIHSFIVLPAVTFLYLSHLPKKLKSGLYYTLAWIAGSFFWSVFVWQIGNLSFHRGYKVWMDIPFYILMYGCIALHQRRPFLTYFISIIIIAFYVLIFNVPW